MTVAPENGSTADRLQPVTAALSQKAGQAEQSVHIRKTRRRSVHGYGGPADFVDGHKPPAE
jgi:hypothetical protein